MGWENSATAGVVCPAHVKAALDFELDDIDIDVPLEEFLVEASKETPLWRVMLTPLPGTASEPDSQSTPAFSSRGGYVCLWEMSLSRARANTPQESRTPSISSRCPSLVYRPSIRTYLHHTGLNGFEFCCPLPAAFLPNVSQIITLICRLALALLARIWHFNI